MVRTWRIYWVVLGALGVALLAPLSFGDPNSTDPHAVRLALTAGGLAVLAYLKPSLRPARIVLLAFSGVVIPYVLWASSLQLLPSWFPVLNYGVAVFLAGAVMTTTTVALVLLLKREGSLNLRLGRLGWRAVAFALAGVAAFILLTLAFPATALGRVGVAVPAALASLTNGLAGGDVLQAFSQELAFRGALLSALERDLKPWQANLAQSLLFGLGHLALEQYEGPVVTLVPLTVGLGMGLGWMTQKTKSLWPAIVIHIVAELAVRIAVIPGLYGG